MTCLHFGICVKTRDLIHEHQPGNLVCSCIWTRSYLHWHDFFACQASHCWTGTPLLLIFLPEAKNKTCAFWWCTIPKPTSQAPNYWQGTPSSIYFFPAKTLVKNINLEQPNVSSLWAHKEDSVIWTLFSLHPLLVGQTCDYCNIISKS